MVYPTIRCHIMEENAKAMHAKVMYPPVRTVRGRVRGGYSSLESSAILFSLAAFHCASASCRDLLRIACSVLLNASAIAPSIGFVAANQTSSPLLAVSMSWIFMLKSLGGMSASKYLSEDSVN